VTDTPQQNDQSLSPLAYAHALLTQVAVNETDASLAACLDDLGDAINAAIAEHNDLLARVRTAKTRLIDVFSGLAAAEMLLTTGEANDKGEGNSTLLTPQQHAAGDAP
jgi:ABC-type transporter Mla subunit MlaD